MLPIFAIRRLWQGGESQRDGLVRMAAEDYDALVARQPSAALSYLDEEDGETVEVGSGFELSQRLQDPPSTKAAAINVVLDLDQYVVDKRPDMHRFDVRRSESNLATWRDLDKITQDGLLHRPNQSITRSSLSQNALTFSPLSSPLSPASEALSLSHHDASVDSNSSLTPKGRRLAEVAGSKLHSPLRDVPATQHRQPGSVEAVHESRWATYASSRDSPYFSQLPSLNAHQATVSQVDDQGLEIPSPPAEHRPLLDLYEAELARLKSFRRKSRADATAPVATSDGSNGLLSVREFLDPLKHSQSDSSYLPELDTKSDTANDTPDSLPRPEADLATTDKTSNKPTPPNPGEVFAHSLRSLGEGLKDLAGSLKQFLPEVQQHLATAQQKLPHQIDHALRASVSNLTNALEQFDPTASRRHTAPAAPVAPPASMNLASVARVAVEPQDAWAKAVPVDAQVHEMSHGQPDGSEGILKPVEPPLTTRRIHTSKLSQDKPLPPLIPDDQQASTNKENQPPPASSPATVTLPSQAKTSVIPPPEYRAQELVGRRFIHYCVPDGPVFKQYLVRWCGCSSDEDTWYDVKNLKDCADLVEAYDRQNPVERRHVALRPSLKRAYDAHASNLHVRTAANPMMVFKDDDSHLHCEAEPHRYSGTIFDEQSHCVLNYLPREATRRAIDSADNNVNADKLVSREPYIPPRTRENSQPIEPFRHSSAKASQKDRAYDPTRYYDSPAAEMDVPKRSVSFAAPKAENHEGPRVIRRRSLPRKESATGPDRFAKSPPPPLPPKEVKHRKSWHPDSSGFSFWNHATPSPMEVYHPEVPVTNANTDAALPVTFPELPPLEPLVPQRETDIHHNPWTSDAHTASILPLPSRENVPGQSSLGRPLSWRGDVRGHLPSEVRPRSKMLRRAESARFASSEARGTEEGRPHLSRQDKNFDSPPLAAHRSAGGEPPKLDLNDSSQVEYIAADTICPLPKPLRGSNLRHCQSAAELNRRKDKTLRVKDWVSQASNNLHASTDANELYAPPSPLAYAANPTTTTTTTPLLPLTNLDVQPLPAPTSSYGPYISPFDSPPASPALLRRSQTLPSNAAQPYKNGKELDCLNKLTELGYGTREFTGGWDDKLAFVTREVQGELNAAIDRLEEDRLAWEMRR